MGIDIGRGDGSGIRTTPFIEFHTDGDTDDFDVQIIAQNPTGTNRYLSVVAGSLQCDIGKVSGNVSCTSDARMKNVQGTLTDNVAKLSTLNPIYFTWKDTENGYQQNIGLLAQEVQAQFPELVGTDQNGLLSVNYAGLVAPLIGAVKEQQASINNLNTIVASLQSASLTDGGMINGDITISGNLAVNGNVTVTGELRTNDIYVGGHIVTVGMTPTAVLGEATGAPGVDGTGAPTGSVNGTDNAGTISVTAGMQNVLSGSVSHVSFAKAFSSPYKVVISASNDNAAELKVYVLKTATGFDVVSRDTLQPGTHYEFDYIVLGAQN